MQVEWNLKFKTQRLEAVTHEHGQETTKGLSIIKSVNSNAKQNTQGAKRRGQSEAAVT